MMKTDYYIAINKHSEGPYTLEELRTKNLTTDTLVWKTGLPEWVKAKDLPELSDLNLSIEIPPLDSDSFQSKEEPIWYAMIDNNTKRIGPLTLSDLIKAGITESTPVWMADMPDWAPASTREEIITQLRNTSSQFYNQNNGPRNTEYGHFSQNPQYGAGPQFHQNPQYRRDHHYNQNPYQRNQFGNSVRVNWMPWAIGATITGFFFSCIGAIFGIIAIVQASKANNCYAMGDDLQGDNANSTAKTMTIIGYIMAGLGLIFSIWFTSGFSGAKFW